jgi:hypothetical protein
MRHPQAITFVFNKEGLKTQAERGAAYMLYESWIEHAFELRIASNDVSFMKLYVPIKDGDLLKDTTWLSATLKAEWESELTDVRGRIGEEP